MSLRTRHLTLACLLSALGLLGAPSFAAAAGDLTPTPSQLGFGPQDIHNGSTASQEVELDNSTGETLTVSSVETTGPDAVDFPNNNACGVVEDGNSCAVSVSFDPATVGAKEAQLEIVDDNGTVVVPLTGSGVTGTLSGSSPTFEPQPYFFDVQERSANISNPSSFAAAATVATITGPDAAFFSVGFNGCQFVIPPGGSCSVGVDFNPSGPGTKNAQLELSNDGTVDPLVIPLTATALAGPDAVISPAQASFGDVAIGSTSAPWAFTIKNAGDYTLQIQQLLLLSGTPQTFPLTADSCSSHSIAPAASCQFTVSFQPSGNGEREGTVFVTTKENGPTYTASLVGNGVPSPNGTATVTGAAAAGSQLTCVPDGYPDGTRFAYQWLRNGGATPGATGARFTPDDADVGSRLACRLRATNSVGSETVTSPQSAPISPKSLSGLDGSLVGPSVCRIVRAPARLKLGGRTVKLRYGKPTTPGATFRLDSPGLKMQATIEGQPIASGKGRVVLTPRTLQHFADGANTLRVSSKSAEASAQIVLAPCGLAVALDGGPRRATTVTVSASAGIGSQLVRLPKGLRLHVARATLGTVSVQVDGQPAEAFSLFGARSRSNGIKVRLKAHAIEVNHLPTEAGVVSVELNPGVVSGRGGAVKATATLRGSAGPSHAAAQAIWRP